MSKTSFHQRLAVAMALLLLLSSSPPATAQEGGSSGYDALWDYANLYDDPDGTFLRHLALSGRAHGDYARVDADEGDYDDLRWRRFRFGFSSRFAGDLSLHLEGDFDLNNSPGDLYNRLTDAHVEWQPRPGNSLKLLKQSAGFTLDGTTSSKKLLTLERNNLTNNLWFTAEYFTGASLAGGNTEGLDYKLGLFSSDPSDEIGVSDGSYFTLVSVDYNLAQNLGLERATLGLDYVYNDKDSDANTRDFDHVVAIISKWEQSDWGLWTDLSAGKGYYEQSDVYGLVLMPFYRLSDRVQLVGRYSWLESDDNNGLRLNRYENRIVAGRGDDYTEYFAGLNLYLYNHRLKWQTGLQYATMDDDARDGGEYDGWGFSTGLRIYW